MTEQPIRKCRGIQSPFGVRPFRRCTECQRFEYEVRDLKPQMARTEDGTWHCPNELTREVA
jgi:hypothetical protein